MYKIIEDPKYKYLRLDPIPSEEIVEKYYKEDFDSKIWDKTINVNLKGTFLACKYFLKFHYHQKLQFRGIF